MILIEFEKKKLEVFLDALANGKPIPPGEKEGWSHWDMLALAGACLCGASSHGPAAYNHQATLSSHQEHREAEEETFYSELSAAAHFLAGVCLLLHAGGYDSQYADLVKVIIRDTETEAELIPVEGVKKAA